jgi:hypothetical protein
MRRFTGIPGIKFLLFVLISSFLISGCDDSRKMDETQAPPAAKDSARLLKESVDYDFSVKSLYVDSVPGDTSEVTFISGPAAVFTQPDTSAIKDLIGERGEEEFYTLSDDNMFYQTKASEFLKSKGLQPYFPDSRYIALKGKDRNYFIDTQKAGNKGWLTILFDPANEPELVNPLKIEKEYERFAGHSEDQKDHKQPDENL